MKKFLIVSPGYNPINGGVIALHKLCHLINQSGGEAYLHPTENNFEINKFNYHKILYKMLKDQIRSSYRTYKLNPAFNTPLLKNSDVVKNSDEWVTVYPEITFGNPLNSKNVVRWLLHNPGFHTKKIYYSPKELYFKFNSAIVNFNFPGSTTSHNELKVIHYPTEHYNLKNTNQHRSGTAYCLRKGINKKIIHDLKNSILIDGLDHASVANILKNVKTFISYDTYTAYSIFAVLCGCESVVVPDDGISEEQWYPNSSDRYGIAYGFENIDKAKKTKHLVLNHIIEEEKNSEKNVQDFIKECNAFFSSK